MVEILNKKSLSVNDDVLIENFMNVVVIWFFSNLLINYFLLATRCFDDSIELCFIS